MLLLMLLYHIRTQKAIANPEIHQKNISQSTRNAPARPVKRNRGRTGVQDYALG